MTAHPAELGKIFGGMTGAQGGTAIKPDGSNINPVALALLNFKLPDGTFPDPHSANCGPDETTCTARLLSLHRSLPF